MKEKDSMEISKETQLRYAMRCLENNPDGVFWTDRAGFIVYANKAACHKLGYKKEELLGLNVTDIDADFTIRNSFSMHNFVNASINGDTVRIQTLHKHKDGHLIPVDISFGSLENEGKPLGFSIVRDITEYKIAENRLKEAYFYLEKNNIELEGLYNDISEREKQLEHIAYHDELTGLPNKPLLTVTLNNKISALKGGNGKFTLLFIDFDNFKNINDSIGHSAGDIILIEASQRMESCIREGDSIYRFGGDEFVIIMRDALTDEDINAFSERLRNCFAEPFAIDMLSVYITCSIGASIFPDDAESAEELLMYADTAMNKAKSEGKNSIRLYNRDIKHEVIKKIDMQTKLRNALELDEFFLQYQPQYSLKTGLIRGIEALVRWKSPSLGIVKPNDFIPVAEEMGYIVPLGKWALKKACCDAAKWEKEFGYTGLISVNVSARQLNNADFVETIREAIVTSGVNPKKLELEITESMFISSFETAVPKLADIIDLGARICLDDFGKGYSSLGYLMQLPIDTLKIDKSFIAHTETNMIKSNIAASIAALVNDLGIESIVEGVETEKQFEFIRHTRTNDLQGFLFSRPVNEDMIGEILERNNRGIPFNGVLKN